MNLGLNLEGQCDSHRNMPLRSPFSCNCRLQLFLDPQILTQSHALPRQGSANNHMMRVLRPDAPAQSRKIPLLGSLCPGAPCQVGGNGHICTEA